MSKVVIYFGAHGEMIPGTTVNIGKLTIISPVSPGSKLNMTSYNFMSKMFLESVKPQLTSSSSEHTNFIGLKDALKWLSHDLPTTEIIPPDSTIAEHKLYSVFEEVTIGGRMEGKMLFPDFRNNPCIKPASKYFQHTYGDYAHQKLKFGKMNCEFYINHEGVKATASQWRGAANKHSYAMTIGSKTIEVATPNISEDTLIYAVPSGKGSITTSETFPYLKSLHFLITSDKNGQNVRLEDIYSNLS